MLGSRWESEVGRAGGEACRSAVIHRLHAEALSESELRADDEAHLA